MGCGDRSLIGESAGLWSRLREGSNPFGHTWAQADCFGSTGTCALHAPSLIGKARASKALSSGFESWGVCQWLLAQLAEHGTVNARVAGSSPA